MAGIVATSLTTNNSASTAVDTSVTGYLTGEAVTLTTTPTGSSYAWTLSAPGGSTRTRLNVDDMASVRFTPDVAGYYVITCTVSGVTVYVMRLAAISTGVVSTVDGLRLVPLEDTQVPTPSLGVTLFYSSDQDALSIKDSSGDVFTVDVTAV
jgi:hypothetical protein